MEPRPYILAETNWKTVKAEDYQLAILPWGATEAHNYHLPYATDNIQCDHIAAKAAEIAWEQGAKVVVLPTVPFGVNTGQHDVKLDLNLNPSTQHLILDDITAVLNRQGIFKLLIMNGHGGNDFKQMVRELGLKYPDMFISTCNWYQAVDLNKFFTDGGDHAGEMETSVMMNIVPEWILPLTEAGDGYAKTFRIEGLTEGWAWAERKWTQVTRDTGIGDPRMATKENGRAYLEAITEKLAKLMIDISQADPKDLYK